MSLLDNFGWKLQIAIALFVGTVTAIYVLGAKPFTWQRTFEFVNAVSEEERISIVVPFGMLRSVSRNHDGEPYTLIFGGRLERVVDQVANAQCPSYPGGRKSGLSVTLTPRWQRHFEFVLERQLRERDVVAFAPMWIPPEERNYRRYLSVRARDEGGQSIEFADCHHTTVERGTFSPIKCRLHTLVGDDFSMKVSLHTDEHELWADQLTSLKCLVSSMIVPEES